VLEAQQVRPLQGVGIIDAWKSCKEILRDVVELAQPLGKQPPDATFLAAQFIDP